MKKEYICKVRLPYIAPNETYIYYLTLQVVSQHSAKDIYFALLDMVVDDCRRKGLRMDRGGVDFLFISLVN